MFGERIHRFIFLFALVALAAGMMLGTVPTSVPQLVLMGNWLLEGRFRQKWLALRNNYIFWVLSSVFLIHVVGLLYTSDLKAGWDDVRTKIPLMFLPMLFFSSAPLTRKQWRMVAWAFLTGCIADVGWCWLYSRVLHSGDEVRNASRFMSHIRLGLYLDLALCFCVWMWMHNQARWQKLLLFLIALILLVSLPGLGLMTGIINLLLLAILAVMILLFSVSSRWKWMVIGVVSLCSIFIGSYMYRIAAQQLSVRNETVNLPQKQSVGGHPYYHFENDGQRENGYYIHINVQIAELERCWNRDFPNDQFHVSDHDNIHRFYSLLRYMSSKGLLKDSAGYQTLSMHDKELVSKDVPNYLYPEWNSFRKRFYELVNEGDDIRHHRHVNGHSVTMRPYFWRAALHGISKHPLFGVGTGDVQQSQNESYRQINSPLLEEWYKRPHNQFLTVMLAVGVPGLLCLLVSLIYPGIILRKEAGWLYVAFIISAVFSFMTEDTLETQAGLTFFAFFNSWLLSDAYFKKTQSPEGSQPSR